MRRVARIAVAVALLFVVLGLTGTPPASAQALQLGETAIESPSMQEPASFNLTAVKAKIEAAIKERQSQ